MAIRLLSPSVVPGWSSGGVWTLMVAIRGEPIRGEHVDYAICARPSQRSTCHSAQGSAHTVHHPRHRLARAGAHRHEQRILGAAEATARIRASPTRRLVRPRS
jgi:hypothetical protein